MSASRPLGSQKTGSIKKLTQTKAYCPFCVFSHSWIKVAFKKAASSLPQVSRLLSRAKLHSFSNKHMKITKYFTLTILYPQKSICCQNNTIVKGKKMQIDTNWCLLQDGVSSIYTYLTSTRILSNILSDGCQSSYANHVLIRWQLRYVNKTRWKIF